MPKRKGQGGGGKGKAPKDFKKLKRKVGRRAPLKTNDTKTGFKYRRVNVASQSIMEEKGEQVTKRSLNINDLLTKLKHYNAAVRKSGFSGLRELHEDHPESVIEKLPEVLSALFEGLADPGKQAREAAIDTLDAVLADINLEHFRSSAVLCSAHIRAALTHLNIGIRMAGIEALRMILDFFPSSLAAQAMLLINALLPLMCPSSGGNDVATYAAAAKVKNDTSMMMMAKKNKKNKKTKGGGGGGDHRQGGGNRSSNSSDMRFEALQCVFVLLQSCGAFSSPPSGQHSSSSSSSSSSSHQQANMNKNNNNSVGVVERAYIAAMSSVTTPRYMLRSHSSFSSPTTTISSSSLPSSSARREDGEDIDGNARHSSSSSSSSSSFVLGVAKRLEAALNAMWTDEMRGFSGEDDGDNALLQGGRGDVGARITRVGVIVAVVKLAKHQQLRAPPTYRNHAHHRQLGRSEQSANKKRVKKDWKQQHGEAVIWEKLVSRIISSFPLRPSMQGVKNAQETRHICATVNLSIARLLASVLEEEEEKAREKGKGQRLLLLLQGPSTTYMKEAAERVLDYVSNGLQKTLSRKRQQLGGGARNAGVAKGIRVLTRLLPYLDNKRGENFICLLTEHFLSSQRGGGSSRCSRNTKSNRMVGLPEDCALACIHLFASLLRSPSKGVYWLSDESMPGHKWLASIPSYILSTLPTHPDRALFAAETLNLSVRQYSKLNERRCTISPPSVSKRHPADSKHGFNGDDQKRSKSSLVLELLPLIEEKEEEEEEEEETATEARTRIRMLAISSLYYLAPLPEKALKTLCAYIRRTKDIIPLQMLHQLQLQQQQQQQPTVCDDYDKEEMKTKEEAEVKESKDDSGASSSSSSLPVSQYLSFALSCLLPEPTKEQEDEEKERNTKKNLSKGRSSSSSAVSSGGSDSAIDNVEITGRGGIRGGNNSHIITSRSSRRDFVAAGSRSCLFSLGTNYPVATILKHIAGPLESILQSDHASPIAKEAVLWLLHEGLLLATAAQGGGGGAGGRSARNKRAAAVASIFPPLPESLTSLLPEALASYLLSAGKSRQVQDLLHAEATSISRSGVGSSSSNSSSVAFVLRPMKKAIFPILDLFMSFPMVQLDDSFCCLTVVSLISEVQSLCQEQQQNSEELLGIVSRYYCPRLLSIIVREYSERFRSNSTAFQPAIRALKGLIGQDQMGEGTGDDGDPSACDGKAASQFWNARDLDRLRMDVRGL